MFGSTFDVEKDWLLPEAPEALLEPDALPLEPLLMPAPDPPDVDGACAMAGRARPAARVATTVKVERRIE